MTTKEEYVEQLKACCQEIIERADEFMPEPEFRTQVKFTINFAYDTMPHIEISQVFVPLSTVKIINKYICPDGNETKKRVHDCTKCGGMGSQECESCDMPCPYR